MQMGKLSVKTITYEQNSRFWGLKKDVNKKQISLRMVLHPIHKKKRHFLIMEEHLNKENGAHRRLLMVRSNKKDYVKTYNCTTEWRGGILFRECHSHVK
ncbi:hypothetical protein ACTXT7_006734 [Hymenolepis weldensis]